MLPISVIIPTYCRAELTAQALLSVCRQTRPPNEVLIIDDASADFDRLNSLCNTIAEQFFQKQGGPTLSCSSLVRHLGMPGALRNIGMRRARNSWLAFLDSDDIWLPEKLETQWLLHDECKVLHSRELWLRFGASQQDMAPSLSALAPDLLFPPFSKPLMPQLVAQKKPKALRELWPAALKKCIMGPSTVLLHRSVCEEVGYFDPQLQIAEDYEYFLRVIAKFGQVSQSSQSSQISIGYSPEYLIAKRDHILDQNSEPIPQLSHKYSSWARAGIEPFRLEALERLLLRRARLLSLAQEQSAIAELCRKITICLNGAIKRSAAREEIRSLQAKLSYWAQKMPNL